MQLEAQITLPIKYSISIVLDQPQDTPTADCTYTVKCVDYAEDTEHDDDDEYYPHGYNELASLRYEEVDAFCKRLENKDPELIAELGLPTDYVVSTQPTLGGGLQDLHNLGLAEAWGVPKPITMQRHYVITDSTQHIVIQKSLFSAPDFDEDENEDDTLAPLRVHLKQTESDEDAEEVCMLQEYTLIGSTNDGGDFERYNWINNFCQRTNEDVIQIVGGEITEIECLREDLDTAKNEKEEDKIRRKIDRLKSKAYKEFAKKHPIALTLQLRQSYGNGPWQYNTENDVDEHFEEFVECTLEHNEHNYKPYWAYYAYVLMSREQILSMFGGERITKDKIKEARKFITSMVERMNDIASGHTWAHKLDFDNASFPNLDKDLHPFVLTQIGIDELNDFENKIENLDLDTMEQLGLPEPENFSVDSTWEDYKENYYFTHKELVVKTERSIAPIPSAPQQE